MAGRRPDGDFTSSSVLKERRESSHHVPRQCGRAGGGGRPPSQSGGSALDGNIGPRACAVAGWQPVSCVVRNLQRNAQCPPHLGRATGSPEGWHPRPPGARLSPSAGLSGRCQVSAAPVTHVT